MTGLKYFLFLSIVFSSTCFAACHKHQKNFETYEGHISELKERHCFFPETGERKPCIETEIGDEVKVRKLASMALYSACDDSKSSK